MNTQSVQNAGQSEAAADAPSEDMEFDADLDAAISAMDGAPADDAAAPVEREEQQQSAVEAPAPAPDAAADAPGADGNASPQGSATDDIWANAPAELREAFEKQQRDAELRFRSANGRVSALQRQLAQYQQQTQQQPAQQQEPQRETQQPEQRPSGINLTDPKFQQLREDYPEVAGPLLDVIADLSSQLGNVRQVAGTFEQQQTQAFLAQQEQALAQAHPDWVQAAADDRFAGWLETQPTAIQEAFQRNHDAIVNGQDAALVIGMFKQAVGFSSPQQQQTPTNPAPTQDPRRQRQLAAGKDAGRNSPPAASGIADNDFDAHLDAAIAKLDKQL